MIDAIEVDGEIVVAVDEDDPSNGDIGAKLFAPSDMSEMMATDLLPDYTDI